MRALGGTAFAVTLLAAAGAAHAAPLDDAIEDHRVAIDPKATPGVRQEAQFSLARRLHRMRLYQGAYAMFAEIADKPEHVAFARTLPWLAKLETDLPRPADVDERLAKYGDRAIEANHLEFYRGRWAFTNRRYEEAIRWFAKVERGSLQYPRAWFYAGVANVQLKRAPGAVAAFFSCPKFCRGYRGVTVNGQRSLAKRRC
jgi:Flp pilus assembly protein TadD